MPIDTSTLISALALLVSVVAAATGALSVRTSRAALRASQERFAREGPILDIRSMYTYGAPPHENELIGLDVEVRNAGRTPQSSPPSASMTTSVVTTTLWRTS